MTNLHVSGQITDESSASFLDNVAPSDAPAMAHLCTAGAVIHGRTYMPDLGMRWNTDNPLYGKTYNPWGRTKSPGGPAEETAQRSRPI